MSGLIYDFYIGKKVIHKNLHTGTMYTQEHQCSKTGITQLQLKKSSGPET